MQFVREHLGPREADLLVWDGESKCWTTVPGFMRMGFSDCQLGVVPAQRLLLSYFKDDILGQF